MVKLNKILIDTNILIYMYKYKKDIFDFVDKEMPNAKFFILDKALEELKKVYSKKPIKYRLVKKYLNKLKEVNKYKILIVENEILKKYEKIDKLLIYYSKDYLIYTNDKLLKKEIKKKKGRVIVLKLHGVSIE